MSNIKPDPAKSQIILAILLGLLIWALAGCSDLFYPKTVTGTVLEVPTKELG